MLVVSQSSESLSRRFDTFERISSRNLTLLSSNYRRLALGRRYCLNCKIIQELYLDEDVMKLDAWSNYMTLGLANNFNASTNLLSPSFGSYWVVFPLLDRYQRYFGSRRTIVQLSRR